MAWAPSALAHPHWGPPDVPWRGTAWLQGGRRPDPDLLRARGSQVAGRREVGGQRGRGRIFGRHWLVRRFSAQLPLTPEAPAPSGGTPVPALPYTKLPPYPCSRAATHFHFFQDPAPRSPPRSSSGLTRAASPQVGPVTYISPQHTRLQPPQGPGPPIKRRSPKTWSRPACVQACSS